MDLEQKILLAAQQSEKVIEIFSPRIAELEQAGVAVEPIFSALVRGIIGLFHHHTGVAPATK